MSLSKLFRGKRSRLMTIFISFAAVCLVAIVLCFVLLLLRERDFAAASERGYVISLISSHRDEINGLLADYVHDNISEYENKSSVLSELLSFTPDTLSYIRASDCADDRPIYSICFGQRHILTVILERGRALSGFDSWEVSDISLPSDGGPAYPVMITAPHGATVTVNGKQAAESERAGYSPLTVFEADLSDKYYCDSYSLGRLFSTPTVTAELDGIQLSSAQTADGTIFFPYPQSMTKVATFTVPYGADVTVNGIEPDAEFIIQTGVKYKYLTRFEENMSGAHTCVSYQIIGLFRTPEISVTYNGTPLVAADGHYRLPDSETGTITVLAPADATVKINGVAVGSGEITSERAEIPIMEGVTGYAKHREYLVEYTVSGLLTTPSVSAVLKGGKPIEADINESSSDRIVFLPLKTSTEPPKNDKVTVKAFATYYLKYLLGGSGSANTNLRNVTDMTPSKTPAYDKLKALLPTVRESSAVKNLKMETPAYSEYTQYTSSSFSATITLPYTYTENGETIEGSITMKILYIFSGNIRRVVNFTVYR